MKLIGHRTFSTANAVDQRRLAALLPARGPTRGLSRPVTDRQGEIPLLRDAIGP